MAAAWTIASGVCAASLMLGACTINTVSTSPGTTGGGGGPAQAAPNGASGASTQPMLVVVDANRTMTAQPGDGVGVFTEYTTGGHWHVWWSCDSNRTNLDCNFDVTISVASSISNAAGEGLAASDQIAQASAMQVELVTRTTTTIQGVTFDAPPGDIITLDAKMNALDDGNLLFFVQDGQINGGYRGTLTDPLMLQPSSP
jgi:hypothetical protein